ncbi:divergent polysaccharide deacetylase family protein [Sulfurovum sp. XGS-02]|uniref:divergent polysaccharide deacetylase family protein n=1 Tax=Sulfurovum sp. XGS-02 TaxID=2925411 RepID=UPI00205752AA|nr:divergent polysaccharide deacetylase family protein [Sulfurovum sp. XGS-02]UPT77920.1 divergent polysaccharide deacetylase family protein [Sulfurovum sp. XGS-02]
MANQPKKTTTKSSSRKKSVQKRRRKKSTKGSTLKKSLFIVLGVFLMIAMVVFGYFLGQLDLADGQKRTTQTYKRDTRDSTNKFLEELSKIKTKKPREKQEIVVQKAPKREKNSSVKPLLQKEANEEEVVTKDEMPKRMITHNVLSSEITQKPKLVIIIDDVSTRDQIKRIQATGIKLTPSIFPPSERSSTSHRLAEGLEHYMIHLPMESGTAQFNTQAKTLITTFSKAEIDARVNELRALFPTARYINNHTGSVFTDNYAAMRRLYSALRKEGFLFVDSRTTASTKVPMIAEEFGDAYVARDVFIDNQQSVPYIHKQLQRAVKKAKKKGYAIAIGHPHKITMKALSSAAAIFKGIEVVYMDEVYR